VKRIYFVACDAVAEGSNVMSRRELLTSGALTKEIKGAEQFLKSEIEKETVLSLKGCPRISGFKWVGIVALGRNWRWN